MTNERKKVLSEIMENENLLKLAQELSNNATEVDQATADQIANQIFEQIFDEELKKVLSES